MNRFRFSLFRIFWLGCALLAGNSLVGQIASPATGVPVKIWGTSIVELIEEEEGDFELSGTFLPSNPTANDAHVSAFNTTDITTELTTVLGIVHAAANRTYQLQVSGTNLSGTVVNIVAPAGYRVLIDNEVRMQRQMSGEGVLTFVVEALGIHNPSLAGIASSVSTGEVRWSLPLGVAEDGRPAGQITLSDRGTQANWAHLFAFTSLSYEPISPDVSVQYQGSSPSKIFAGPMVVAMHYIDSTSYEIKIYSRNQLQGAILYGDPYVRYKIEKGPTSTSLKFTREFRNVTSRDPGFPVVRRELMTLERSGTWPTFTWTKVDWHEEGQTPLVETVVTSSGTTSNRTETVVVRPPGGAAALSLTRNFSAGSAGEMLGSETLGATNGATTSYDYYVNSGHWDDFGMLKSATLPGGGWAAFEYYDADLNTNTPFGRIKRRYRPFQNSPGTATLNDTQGEVTYYEYTHDLWGAKVRPTLVETKVNNVVIAKTTYSYNINAGSVGVFQTEAVTQRDYSNSSQYVETTTRRFRTDQNYSSSTYNLKGATYSIVRPDGVKQSFAHYSLATAIITGLASNPGGATLYTDFSHPYSQTQFFPGNSVNIDDLYLVEGKSTMEATVREYNGLTLRTISFVWSGGQWHPLSRVDYTYDYIGQLILRVGSNGATYTATYDAMRKTSETDESGVTTYFTYDAGGRVIETRREAYGPVGEVRTRFTYDALGNVIEQRVGYGQTEQLVTTRTYDDAGRLATETGPGLGTIAHSYDVANRTHTVTKPKPYSTHPDANGGTVIDATYLDGRSASRTGTAIVPTYHTYGTESDGRMWSRVDAATSSSARWKKTWTNWVGKVVKIDEPAFGGGTTTSENFYHATTGLLTKSTAPGRAATLYEYNAFGELFRNALDVDASNTIGLNSTDRITETIRSIESYQGYFWQREETKKYHQASSSTPITMGIVRRRLSGHIGVLDEVMTTDELGNVTTQTKEVTRSARMVTTTTVKSAVARPQIETVVNGLPYSSITFNGLTTVRGYDTLLRPATVTDSRGNTTTTAYVAGTSHIATITDAASNVVALHDYDALGRTRSTRDAASHYTRTEYSPRGEVIRQWGGATNPVEYEYNSFGERTKMRTFRDSGTDYTQATWPHGSYPSSTGDTTTWTYDAATGLLTAKTDAASQSVTYSYTAAGQLELRTWARGVTTSYTYDSATGEQRDILYSDATPDLEYTYNRLGQLTYVDDFLGLRTLINCLCGKIAEEQLPSAFYGGATSLAYKINSGSTVPKGRTLGYTLTRASTTEQDVTYGFHATTDRFASVATQTTASSGTRTFLYDYEPNSALLRSLAIDGGHPFTINRTYEAQRDHLASVDSRWSTGLRTRHAYAYDSRGLRSSVVQSGDAFADFGDATFQLFTYNGRGELTQAVAYLGSDPTVSSPPALHGRRHEYAYDPIGNRLWSDRNGITALRDEYTANALNQYTARENNTVPLSGTALPAAAVAVQGRTVPAGRRGPYWNDEVTVANTAGPWRGPLSVYTGLPGTGGGADLLRRDSRMAQLPAVAQSFTYDLDGNLTSDGIWDYTWDAENRLIAMQAASGAVSAGYPHQRLEFAYDYLGRRAEKRVLTGWNGSTFATVATQTRYLYDGWNLIAEYAVTSTGPAVLALRRSYTWGLDIARSESAAGGVGALLQVTDHASNRTYLASYDGNGNVVALTNAANGALATAYEYSPYGEPLRAEVRDPLIAGQPFRFSTKYTDDETGLIYYGRRYYDCRNGRFLGRDPIEEKGGLHLYGFVGNNPANRWDYLGMVEQGIVMMDKFVVDGSGMRLGVTTYEKIVGYDEEGCAIVQIYEVDDYGETEAGIYTDCSKRQLSAEEILLDQLNAQRCTELESSIKAISKTLKHSRIKRKVGLRGLLRSQNYDVTDDAGLGTADIIDMLTNVASLSGKYIAGDSELWITAAGVYSGTAANGYNAVAGAADGNTVAAISSGYQAIGNNILTFAELSGSKLAGRLNPWVAAGAVLIRLTEQGALLYLDAKAKNENTDFWIRQIDSAEYDINKWTGPLERKNEEWGSRNCEKYGYSI